MKIKTKLQRLRDRAYTLEGCYEDSYTFLMEGLDKIIGELKDG